MKTFFASLVVVSLTLFSCSKEKITQTENSQIEKNAPSEQQSSSHAREGLNLAENENFIALTNDMFDYLEFTIAVKNRQSLDFESLESSLRALESSNSTYMEQLTAINELFNEDITEILSQHMATFSSNWRVINENLGSLSNEEIEEATAEILRIRLSTLEAPNDCGWRYYLCMTAATAGAILCHAACDTTALATTAGLGIPACVALCATLQVAAGVQCFDNYCD